LPCSGPFWTRPGWQRRGGGDGAALLRSCGRRFSLPGGGGFVAALRAAAWLVPVAALCSVGVLGLVVHSGLRQGLEVGASARLVVACGRPLWVALVLHLGRNPCSGLAGVGDGDGRGRHMLSWKHRCEVCALLRLRPRLRRETSDPGSGDGGADVSLPRWGHRLGVAHGQGLGEVGGCRAAV
jgi:hypothetical protein